MVVEKDCLGSVFEGVDNAELCRQVMVNELKGQINDFYFKECFDFISRVKECRHQTILERHL